MNKKSFSELMEIGLVHELGHAALASVLGRQPTYMHIGKKCWINIGEMVSKCRIAELCPRTADMMIFAAGMAADALFGDFEYMKNSLPFSTDVSYLVAASMGISAKGDALEANAADEEIDRLWSLVATRRPSPCTEAVIDAAKKTWLSLPWAGLSLNQAADAQDKLSLAIKMGARFDDRAQFNVGTAFRLASLVLEDNSQRFADARRTLSGMKMVGKIELSRVASPFSFSRHF
jgi:hypothetical protein